MANQQLKSFQHYVPRFLLEYFTVNNSLLVYDRKVDKYRPQSAKTTAGENAYYVFAKKGGELSSALEEMFSQIEGVASGLIKDLASGKNNLDLQGKADLATFIAALYLRVPSSFSRTEEMSVKMTKEFMSRATRFDKHFEKGMDEIEKKLGTAISKKQREEIRKTFVDKNYDLRFPKEHMLKSMMQMFQEFYYIFAQMEWTVLRAPKNKAFIMSDNPALTFNIKPEGFWGSGIGILAPNCETTAVLTPRVCIFLSQKHNPDVIEYVNASPELVDNINFRTAVCSSRFVVSHSEALLKKWVEKTHLDKRGPYISVDVG
jgi:hypothetical protein